MAEEVAAEAAEAGEVGTAIVAYPPRCCCCCCGHGDVFDTSDDSQLASEVAGADTDVGDLGDLGDLAARPCCTH